MNERQVPLYLFTGFLESGKTQLLLETLNDPEFNEEERTLLICCEEGLLVYDVERLKQLTTDIVYVNDFDKLTEEFLDELDKKYQPERIMVEFNGTWSVSDFLNIDFPLDWLIVQIVATVDASSFESYIANMKSLMYEQIVHAGMVIFNRCDSSMKKSFLRGNVKASNPSAQIVYEDVDGNINALAEDELPFDFTATVLDIKPDDYGLWYMDALEHPYKYEQKRIKTIGLVYQTSRDNEPVVALGRYAMVCCEEDTAFIGVGILGKLPPNFNDGEWAEVEATIRVEFDDIANKEYLMLEDASFAKVTGLEQPFVYFN